MTEAMISQVAYLYHKAGTRIDYRKPGVRRIFVEILLEDIMKNHLDDDFKEASELFTKIKVIRNNAAHAGFLHNHRHKEIIEKLNGYIKRINQFFFSTEAERKLGTLPADYPYEFLRNKYRRKQ